MITTQSDTDLQNSFGQNPGVQQLSTLLSDKRADRIQLKGIRGSADTLVISSCWKSRPGYYVIVANDHEEAAYLFNDLQNTFEQEQLFYFPASYKKPYEYEKIDNANVLRRSEVLTELNSRQGRKSMLVVTYGEALAEKVINKRSLIDNTIKISTGQTKDPEELRQQLLDYEFEETDFVYEAGQFAIRGGIVDVYSYSYDLPFRIEFFGEDVESIRTFDPVSQLSKDATPTLNIIPNVEKKLVQEEHQSFFTFLPATSLFWFKDLQLAEEVTGICFEKCSETFQELEKKSGNAGLLPLPEQKFMTRPAFREELDSFSVIEFGNRFEPVTAQRIEFHIEPQPTFKKNFDLLTDNLTEYFNRGYNLFIASESEAQTGRLLSIFEELNPELQVSSVPYSIREGFVDNDLKFVCYTDHQIFERFYRFKLKEKYSRSRAITLKELQSLQPGDFVTHIDYGIGRFAGLEKIDVGGKMQEAVRLIYRDNDLLYVSIHSLHKIAKYSGREGLPPQISKLGSSEWENKKKRAKKKVVDIAKDLISLYAKRKEAPGYAFKQDSFLQAELESSFLYEDTPDQSKATNDVKEDMQHPHPMDRLVCGDVGFGKTEVALRAAFKSVDNQRQVAVLVPTTILAIQHYRTFCERMENMPVRIEYINRFKSTSEVKKILKDLEKGLVDIIIGTHRIVNSDVKFKNLGLLIIDEEQKFGVRVKEKIKEFKVNVDVLTLTATPIPRTLHFSLMGARDLSIISTPPPNRQPVTTELHEFNEEILRDAISDEIRRGGQVFFVHNRISDIEEVANIILKLVPEARITVAHGQMKGHRLEKNMMKFIDGDFDILVSTNIIESGLDIPNANTIIINHAHMFGLSDLHQMRGRVGRSNRKAYCYLLTPSMASLTVEARKRLRTLEEFTELGDGFKVAMRDLDIRGAGNLLGSEQSGFISDLGFDMYHKILDEAVQELKEHEFKDLFEKELKDTARMLVRDCTVETDLQILIPEDYVSNISERLRLYNDLDVIKDENELKAFRTSLEDRFGPIPTETSELIDSVRLRWKAQNMGIEKLTIKNGKLKGYFVSPEKKAFYQSDTFGSIIQFVQSNPARCRLKEVKDRLILTITDIHSITDAEEFLSSIPG